MIYNNFDGFEVSFQGAFSQDILDQLAEAKEQAQKDQNDTLIKLGQNKVRVEVRKSGVHGGYAYIFSTGLDGETWMIKNSTDSGQWNITVSVSSLGLALSGYKALQSAIIKRFIDFEAIGKKRFITASGQALYIPQESIRRLDYCYDFIMDSAFEPLPQNFIAHQRTAKHRYGEKQIIDEYSASIGDVVNTVRIGQMPGKQIAVYNKTKEIVKKSKEYWWDIWGYNKTDIEQNDQSVWRIEVRAGKKELNAWGVKTFEDFESKAGDIVMHIFKKIRYVIPSEKDSNRSRWTNHPLWDECLGICFKGMLRQFVSDASRENILRGYREKYVDDTKKRVTGNAITLGALLGDDIEIVPKVLEDLAADFKTNPPRDASRKFEKAHDRTKLLE